MLKSWVQQEVSYKSFAFAFIHRRSQAESSSGALARNICPVLLTLNTEIRAPRRYQEGCDRQSAMMLPVQLSGRETTVADRYVRLWSVVRLYDENLP